VGIAVAVGLWWTQPVWVERLNLLAYDSLLPAQAARANAPVVIAIDEASLAALGPWPWPRDLHAKALARLQSAEVKAIGMAVLFTERDAAGPQGDAALAAALARHGGVALASAPLAYTVETSQTTRLGSQKNQSPLKTQITASAPLPALLQAAALMGHVDVEMDLDGQSRSVFQWAGMDYPSLPTLALAVKLVQGAQGRKFGEVGTGANAGPPVSGASWVRANEVLVPRVTGLPTLSFAKLIDGTNDTAWLRNRVAFVGITAAGLGGELVTPLAGGQSTLPAVVFHASLFEALQTNTLIGRAPGFWSLLLALMVLPSLAFWPAHTGRRILLSGALLTLPLLASAVLLLFARVWLPPAAVTVSLAAAWLFWIAITLRATNRQLLWARQHARATLEAIDDAVLTLESPAQTIRFANPAAQLHANGKTLVGTPLAQALPLETASMATLGRAVDECLALGQLVRVPDRLTLTSAEGARTLRATVSPLERMADAAPAVVLVLADVSDAVAAEGKLDYAAHHDALTGLPNRAYFHERLSQALARIQRRGGHAAIFFLDLDRFKHINDSLGHRAGDEVLRILGARLRSLCRDTDTVARWGGDEFVLLLEEVDGHDGAANAATKLADALSQDIQLDARFANQRLPSAASVGVVLAPQDGLEMDDLLSKADMAMYRAKAQPQTSFQFWSSDANNRMHERLALEVDLRQSLRDDRFVIHYQPQYLLADGSLIGMEALLRWERKPGQWIMPGDFIAVAEECGLIVDMGGWALGQVARQITLWQKAGLQAVPVSVNVSARQCMNRDIVQVVRQALADTGIAPALLRLEITETTAMNDADQVIGLLEDIRALGVLLSVDDFGTGYSSLSYLKRFPIDELKIDRSFVSDFNAKKDDAAIVCATIALAHGLGLRVVAEGVETQAQVSFLAAHGCDIGQGYFFAHPQPAELIEKILALAKNGTRHVLQPRPA
jgi:diguanylate cyclase (GGDEF)-like protein